MLSAASVLAADVLLPGARRVLVLGDSITHSGQYVDSMAAYFVTRFPDRQIEFLNVGLPSETVSGLSEDGHAGGQFPRPDLHERLGRVLEKVRPDTVIACYGMNDGIYLPYAPERFAAFSNGLVRLREKVTAAGAKIIHVTPPVFDEMKGRGPGYGNTLDRYAEWMMSQRAAGWNVVDLHEPMKRVLVERRQADPKFFLAGDGVHAGELGHWIMAKQILLHLGAKDLAKVESVVEMMAPHANGAAILKLVQQKQRVLKDAWLTDTGHQRPGMAKGLPLAEAQAKAAGLDTQIRSLAKQQSERRASLGTGGDTPAGPSDARRSDPTAPFPGKKSAWNGFDRYDFTVDGKPVLVVTPRTNAPGKPWVWHGEFFGHKPNPDIALLGRGFHVVYLSVPDMLGTPPAVAHWNVFHRALTEKYGFAKKAALVGLSRGGLYCYNWAAANPEKVACLYADAPVCDFKSWPGGFGQGKRSERDWQLILKLHGFKSDDEAKAYAKNPVDNLAPLAAAKVPLLHVFGDADEVVPWEENTGLIAERFQKLGGSITLIRKPGVKHHPHGLDDSTPIVNFIWEHAASAEAKAWWAGLRSQ